MRDQYEEADRRNEKESTRGQCEKAVKRYPKESCREPYERADRSQLEEIISRQLENYEKYLYEKERHQNTIKKYIHDVRHFFRFIRRNLPEEKEQEQKKMWKQEKGDAQEKIWAQEQTLHRSQILQYKEYLIRNYKITSVNSMLAALNGYLKYRGRKDCCVKLCRVQQQIFREEEKELSQEEYHRLVLQTEQEGNLRLGCILQTIGSTGIRVGELKYITAETLDKKIVCIRSKGKERCILLPQSLVVLLKGYCEQQSIEAGSIFITRTGKPIDRRNVWAEMKGLCRRAGVLERKGYPHNLRHLFARTYYEKEKDIVRLADYLGHSNVETTRRYTRVSCMRVCLEQLELGLLVEGYLDGEDDGGGEEVYGCGRRWKGEERQRERRKRGGRLNGMGKDIKIAMT